MDHVKRIVEEEKQYCGSLIALWVYYSRLDCLHISICVCVCVCVCVRERERERERERGFLFSLLLVTEPNSNGQAHNSHFSHGPKYGGRWLLPGRVQESLPFGIPPSLTLWPRAS
jgi:hypothetical protein